MPKKKRKYRKGPVNVAGGVAVGTYKKTTKNIQSTLKSIKI